MSYLVDTNVMSELRKGARGNAGVVRWRQGVSLDELYLSPLVLGELRRGVELSRKRDPVQAAVLERWHDEVASDFSGRLLEVDVAVAEEWGHLSAIRPLSQVDALQAATAKVHGFTFVTRNIKDVMGLGVELLNPFAA